MYISLAISSPLDVSTEWERSRCISWWQTLNMSWLDEDGRGGGILNSYLIPRLDGERLSTVRGIQVCSGWQGGEWHAWREREAKEGGEGRCRGKWKSIIYTDCLPGWLSIRNCKSFPLYLSPLSSSSFLHLALHLSIRRKAKMITNPLPEKIDGVGLQLDETPDRHKHVHADNPNPFPMPDSLTSCFLAFTPHSMPFSKNTVTWIESGK